MKMYDYGHLEEIEVPRDDQKLYTFKEALRMFTRRIVIQRRVEDLQLGVESYQKKLNLTKPDTFSDGTLDDVWSALSDIAKGIRMEYLPMRKWSNLYKKRARVMVYDVGKQLYQRRLMRNLEKFVGGRVYGMISGYWKGQYDSVISCLNSFQVDPHEFGGIYKDGHGGLAVTSNWAVCSTLNPPVLPPIPPEGVKVPGGTRTRDLP
ncbi:hypothetical protein Tco_0209987 [Tanacetum coccineum]